MRQIHIKRLLNVAKALEEAESPRAFSMLAYVHEDPGTNEYFGLNPGFECGTPACAFGHYAARRDLQKTFRIRVRHIPGKAGYCKATKAADIVYGRSRIVMYDELEVVSHFGLTDEEAKQLFDTDGCGNAKTPKQAARFIRNFVKRKQRDRSKSH